jgi:putative transposase
VIPEFLIGFLKNLTRKLKGVTFMSSKSQSIADKWAVFRFSIVGGLLARPPAKGELGKELQKLAEQTYIHPEHNCFTSFHFSTIESWYYKAKNGDDPIVALSRKVRSDIGNSIAVTPILLKFLGKQYKTYPSWSYQLHTDNLNAVIEEREDIKDGPPSYSSVRRRMLERGWVKKKSKKINQTAGQRAAAERLENFEVRSYEAEHVHALWHLDFHEGSMRVVDANGEWHTPKALCILDDFSRLCCHIQWYLNETAEVLIHGMFQAFYKRGLPRGLMTDNGAAMIAHETCNGLAKIGISHERTLPYSPYQNGKQESFWGNLEGRLLNMLTQIESLTMDYLNKATQAWVEMEYNKTRHNEIGMAPIQRMLENKDVSRPSFTEDQLKRSFTICESRKQRQSDGTISINGIRFEVPWRFNHIKNLYVSFTSWDKSVAWLVDKRTGKFLATLYPQDKTKNASGKRRVKSIPDEIKLPDDVLKESEPALLRKLMSEYAQTGMPAAYLPKE